MDTFHLMCEFWPNVKLYLNLHFSLNYHIMKLRTFNNFSNHLVTQYATIVSETKIPLTIFAQVTMYLPLVLRLRTHGV